MFRLSRTFNKSFIRTWLPIILGMALGISLSWIHIADFTNCDFQANSDLLRSNRADNHYGPDDYGDDISFVGQGNVDLFDKDGNSPSDNLNQNLPENNENFGENIDGDEADDFEPRIITDPALKPKVDLEANKKVVRPRYISTELGIREKLFTGVISSKTTINSLAVALNKTLSSHLQKLIFYTEEMSEAEANNNPERMTVVSHKGASKTDEVEILYQTLFDIYNKYQEIYDWFYISYDSTYTQPDRILNIVNHMSITRLLYMGMPMDTAVLSSIETEDKDGAGAGAAGRRETITHDKTITSKYCKKEAGIVISRALLIELVPRLVDCKATISSNNADVWLGQCIISLTAGKIGCISHEEEQVFKSMDLLNPKDLNGKEGKQSQSFNLPIDFETEKSKQFLEAVSVFPVQNEQSIYKLHKRFCKIEIDNTYKKIEEIQEEIKKLASKTPEGEAGLSWPIGVNPPFQPQQRWDIITWDYFTESYSLSCPGEIPKCDLTASEKEDVKLVLDMAMTWVNEKYNKEGLYLHKKKLENGYRRFDPQRGMDYILDINMLASVTPFPDNFNLNGGAGGAGSKYSGKTVELSHRLQLLKPLSHVEIIPMPYVTETSKVNILLPVQKHDKHLLAEYLEFYDENVLSAKDNAQLTIIFVYDSNDAQNLEKQDIFSQGKQLLDKIEEKYPASDRQNGQKKIIPWMSVKTDNFNYVKIVDVISRTNRFAPDTLFFLSSSAVRLTSEFLNRCRMNTISGWQVFFPIPFSSFNPDLVFDPAKGESPPKNIEIKATTGHFDIYSYDEVCFYHGDYKNARQKLKQDADNDLYGMFIEKSELHVFRAVEASLKRVWLLKQCKNVNSDGELMGYLRKDVAASERYCVRSNAEGLAPRAVLGSKIYPEPAQ